MKYCEINSFSKIISPKFNKFSAVIMQWSIAVLDIDLIVLFQAPIPYYHLLSQIVSQVFDETANKTRNDSFYIFSSNQLIQFLTFLEHKILHYQIPGYIMFESVSVKVSNKIFPKF